MKVLLEIVVASLLGLVASCSNSDSLLGNPDWTVDDVAADMVQVVARGELVKLGSDDENVRADERPEMGVRFDYDFSIGRHEVACGEFNALMKSSKGLVLKCKNDSLPATNLTYFDAVYFANLVSKKERLDTVYTYARVDRDSNGHCTNLSGLIFHPEVEGYRLPTEAEWVFVAGRDWNPKEGWNGENSDYKLHKICLKAHSENEMCDMAGNAMEWVNDWFVPFSDTIITNFVGAPDGGSVGRRVVKGGSYRNKAALITLHGRSDVYTVTSPMYADYLGFRLALGAIPNPVWLQGDGKNVRSRVVPHATTSTIYEATGTYRSKLVFRNDMTGNLAYIDYSHGTNAVTEIVDTLDAYHPDISPDGKKVVFCTGIEGVSGQSAVYVRDLNAEGSNLVRLDVKSAAIPRWRVLAGGDTVIVYVTDAGNNRNEAGFMAASTWQVKFEGGKFGIPEKLFDGAYHGGISEDNMLAVSGARLLRARVAKSGSDVTRNAVDTLWYGGEQACNVSLARDSSKRTLFLDFGGASGRKFVGRDYGTHEQILVADASGKLIQSIAAPTGYSFDHSEWVPGRNWAVSTLVNSNGAHWNIVFINMQDGSMGELVEGDELWHPSMWLKPNVITNVDSSLDLDSAGVYLSEGGELKQARFRIKMELYWKNVDTTEVVLVGSSRMEMGVDPDLFPEWNMFNFGVSGIDADRNFYFIDNYLMNHSDRLKAIVVSLDLDRWRGSGDLSSILEAGVGYKYDENHDFWKDGIPTGFVEAVENAYPAPFDELRLYSTRGGTKIPERSWDAEGIDILDDSVFSKKEMRYLNNSLEKLNDLIERASKRNIYVIGIIFPQAPQYRRTGAFGLYGLQRSEAEKKIVYLDSLAQKNRYFVLMDENKMGNHDYTDDMAYSQDHLSVLGAKKLTTRLDSVLKTLEW